MRMSRQMDSPSPSLSLSSSANNINNLAPIASPGGSSYPPHHPLHQSKHSCSICGDRASGKHYGVYSCEGCKGFFKRTVRKDLTYACREDRNCIVDKRQRNRCQYCRYQKCLNQGMRREAVQEERMRSKEKRQRQAGGVAAGGLSGNASNSDSDLESGTTQSIPATPAPRSASVMGASSDLSMERLMAADALILGTTNNQLLQVHTLDFGNMLHQPDVNRQLVEICEKELYMTIQYVRMCPFIAELPLTDQVSLVKCAWNELHLSAMGARAMFAGVKSGLVLSSGLCITTQQAHLFGLGGLVERMSAELITKMTELQVDHFELSCLRGIILFNPDAKGLVNVERVEQCRERLYAALEEHCTQMHTPDLSRFAKLLLRLPSLRSIGLKCYDLLFFSQLFPTLPLHGFLSRLIPNPGRDLRSVAVEVENDEFQRQLREPSAAAASPGLVGPGSLGGAASLPNADFFAALAGNQPVGHGDRMMGQQQHDSPYTYGPPAGSLVKEEPNNQFG